MVANWDAKKVALMVEKTVEMVLGVLTVVR